MSHTALARKYRPRRFQDVVTQEHVSETLRRSVSVDRVGHAYLFAGPRGVGKTTLARVLAMALNCPARTAEAEPCGECESCFSIWRGHASLDVVEIDAASNRGVDDARDLRERAMYAPSEDGRFKVYIVDEAHMLTREAWNTLLKILEEPPARVIFVFATTEPQKIQQTAAPILSRCQRFDFRRVPVPEMVLRLREVLDAEGIPGRDEALHLIARKADGGMRDGLSLLDQVLSLSDGGVGPEEVRRVLGLVEEERYLELMDLLIRGDAAGVFPFVERLQDDGYDLAEFYQGLLDALRHMLRLRLGGAESGGDGFREDLRPAFIERAEAFSPEDLTRMLVQASQLDSTGNLRRNAHPRLLVELLLLRLTYLDRTLSLEEVIRRLGGEGDREPSPRGWPGGAPTDPTPPRGPAPAPPTSAPTPASGSPPVAPDPDPDAPSGATPAGPAEAFGRLVEEGGGLPSGITLVLRAAEVHADGEGLRLVLPPGPGLDRLRDPGTSATLERALQDLLGRPCAVRIEASGGEVSEARISPETVRQGRLSEYQEREPRLSEAVQELDLELRD